MHVPRAARWARTLAVEGFRRQTACSNHWQCEEQLFHVGLRSRAGKGPDWRQWLADNPTVVQRGLRCHRIQVAWYKRNKKNKLSPYTLTGSARTPIRNQDAGSGHLHLHYL